MITVDTRGTNDDMLHTSMASLQLSDAIKQARAGGPERHHEKAAQQGKLPVRERLTQLLDSESLAEDGLLAN